jgi:O-antigen ligase
VASTPYIKRIVPQLLLVLLAVGLFSLPFGWPPLTNLSLLLLGLLSLVVLRKSDWNYSLKQPISIFSISLFVLYALSLFYSEDWKGGLANLETKASFLIAPPILFGLSRNFTIKQVFWLKWVFVAGCVLSLLLILLVASWRAWQYQSWSFFKPNGTQEYFFFLYETFSKPLMHPGYLSTHYGIAILILLFQFKESRYRLLVTTLIIYLGVGMLLLQARMNIIALVLVAGAYFLFWLLKGQHFKLLGAGTALVVLMVVVFLSLAPEPIKERYLAFPDFSYDIKGANFNSATYRLAEWKCATQAWQESFLYGHGIGDSQEALFKSYRELGFREGLERRYNSHNQFLETALSVGLIGLLLLIGLLFSYAYKAVLIDQPFLLASLLFFTLCMLTESMLERAWAVVLFNVYFPLFSGVSSKRD